MTDWLDANVVYWHWISFGFLLMLAELATFSFFLLWMGVAALVVGAMMALTPLSFNTQLIAWVLLSVCFLILWFKFVSPKMKTRSTAGMAMESLVGETGRVLNYAAQKSRGKVRFSAPLLGSDEWEFIHDAPHDVPLDPGDPVVVTGVSGNALLVKKGNGK